MAIRGGYAPPGVYTETVFESPTPQNNFSGRIPLLIGSGTESFAQNGLTVVRGSSATIDQQIVEEDATGRSVLFQNPDGSYSLGDFDGTSNVVRTRQWPIVNGDGTGTTATTSSVVTASINGQPTVVLSINAKEGLVTLASSPDEGDDVRISYFFNRTDNFVDSEDVSTQVTTEDSDLFATFADMAITPATRTLVATIDGVVHVIDLPIKSVNTTRTEHLGFIVSKINALEIGTLTANTYVDHRGNTNLLLSASGSILIGAGTANPHIGVFEGMAGTARNAVFYTAHSPIVDGTNGGIVTSEVSDVVVKVDGVEVTPISLDPTTGAVSLAVAPPVGSSVTISYYFNSFKDNFDFIPSRDVLSVSRVSLVPEGGGADARYIEGVSWVLKDDKIYWGTFAEASVGNVQEGLVSFGSTQITTALRDERLFLAECANVTDTSVVPPRTLPNVFKLPHQPTDGTGTATPTSNPALVQVRVGTSISDALERSTVAVTRVNPADSTITLSQPVPFGSKVFATFYYNNIQDEFDIAGGGYEVQVASVGGSNVGTYTLSRSGLPLFGATYEGKGSDLSLTAINFPSGSEAQSGVSLSEGTPVEETVSVKFASFEPTPAIFTAPKAAPYSFLETTSDTISVNLDNNGALNVELVNPTGLGHKGLMTYMVSEPLPYTASSDNANLGTVDGDLFLKIDGVEMSINLSGGNAIPNATAALITAEINTQAQAIGATYTAMTPIGPYTVIANEHDTLSFQYVDDNAPVAQVDITLTAGSYLSADDLATEINARIDAESTFDSATEFGASAVDGRLVFTLKSLLGGTYGYVEFIEQVDPTDDFTLVAGIDADVAPNGSQTKFGITPIAYSVENDLSAVVGNDASKDRLILRNRTLIGESYFPTATLGIEVIGGSVLTQLGLEVEEIISPRQAVVEAPSLLLRAGWNDQDAVSGSPSVTFYDGTDTNFPANNVLTLNLSGDSYSVTFVGSAQGTSTVLYTTALTAINTQLAGVATATIEGANLRIIPDSFDDDSFISVLDGSANDLFALTQGVSVTSRLVGADALSSALMQAGAWASFESFLTDPAAATGAGSYRADAISYVSVDGANRRYVNFETLSTGTQTSIAFTGGDAITTVSTNLGIKVNDGAVGEASYQGFFVTSTHANGSGTANTSTLNDGTGADGVVGQTYVDSVTGLTFTILPRDGGQPYPSGANSTLTFKVGRVLTANANVPVNAIAGVSLIVANTVGTEVGDTALVETYLKSGKEPSIGTPYYLNVTRRKASFATGVFNRIADVVAAYGPISVDNPLSLGAYIAFLNGASVIALKQISLDEGQSEPTEAQMADALVEVEGEISSGLSPSVIVPLLPASSTLLTDVSLHCDVQSSLRYRSERTAILGCPAGTSPEQAATLARNVGNSRVRLVYPDIVSLSVTDTNGVTNNLIVDGRYLAVATACATTSSTVDVATPWTNRNLVGFNGLLRTLDAVDANKTASAGVSVLQQQGALINIRQGLTTDVSSILAKTPTVVQIADEVHLRARNLLAGYIGQKYLPSVIGQVEGRVNMMFKDLVKQQIIDSYTGLSVIPDPEDPTSLLVDVYYKPIFPLLYIQFTFNVRSSI